jgi:hypothetical protein
LPNFGNEEVIFALVSPQVFQFSDSDDEPVPQQPNAIAMYCKGKIRNLWRLRLCNHNSFSLAQAGTTVPLIE